MNATDVLKRMLDERKIKYRLVQKLGKDTFYLNWSDHCGCYTKAICVEGACVTAEISYLTPEEAVTKTLGNIDKLQTALNSATGFQGGHIMTEKSTSDVLRELLDERGVEWRESVNVANCVFTIYESPTFGEVAAMDNDGTLYFHELNGIDVTPEQAIAATLGSGTCRNQWQWNSGFCCSECFYTVPFVDKFVSKAFRYCPNCGCKIRKAVKR